MGVAGVCVELCSAMGSYGLRWKDLRWGFAVRSYIAVMFVGSGVRTGDREVGSVEGGKYITDIDMELRMLLKHMKDSLFAISCDLKTGKKMASLSVRTAWPLSGCPELRSISAAPAGITARSHRPP